MNIYIVERWNGLDFDIEKILTDFEVTKEHVKRNTKDVSDDYRVTSWTLEANIHLLRSTRTILKMAVC